MMVRSFVPATVSLILILASTANAQANDPKSTPSKDERLSRDTPEGTLRLFTLGVLLGNEALLKATMVPVSEEDLAYLTRKPTGQQLEPKELKELCAKMKVRALKPGDTLTLPGGKELTVTNGEVNDERMILLLENNPIPTRVYKAKGYWWVDAAPVIAGRKAAAKLSAEKASKKASP